MIVLNKLYICQTQKGLRNIWRSLLIIHLTLFICGFPFIACSEAPNERIIAAYVLQDRNSVPDPNLITHLIYAFGEFNEDNDGIIIRKPERLKEIVNLKSQNPELKVILSIAGEKKEGFSEMTLDKHKRHKFVQNLSDLLAEYKLDGVDYDWEFPTTELAGHSAHPDDAKNYAKLIRETRKELGDDKWISVYSNNSAAFIDFSDMIENLSYVNVSGYNLNLPIKDKVYHQSHLYPSSKCGLWCVSKSVKRHLGKGIPRHKVLLGIPLFGRGASPFPSYVECKKFNKYDAECSLEWDEEAQAPYYADLNGNLVLGFDDERSIKAKWDFINSENLSGVFYWHDDADYPDARLKKTLGDFILTIDRK